MTIIGITKSVAGKSSIDQDCSRMFEQRFKYFLATNKRNKDFLIQSIGTTTLEDSRLKLQKTQDNSQLQQAMIHPYMLSTEENNEDKEEEEDDDWSINYLKINYLEDPMLSRPTNPISVLLDGHYKPQDVIKTSRRQECGVRLTTKSSGFLSGQFHLSHDKILNWAQDQNHCEARLIQIQSTCLESKFSPNYGIVNLVEPVGISIISDIDDTIKDTQILSGARTVLSKTFFEPPQGVSGMADAYMAWVTFQNKQNKKTIPLTFFFFLVFSRCSLPLRIQ
jgi:phosphatidate phosphatase APP1